MIAAPKISRLAQLVVALLILSVWALIQASGAVTRANSAIDRIDTLQDDLRIACSNASQRIEKTVNYYNDGVTIYGNFATGWRGHGFFDIASDWTALASRERDRSLAIAGAPPGPGCAATTYSAPPPIKFLPLTKAPQPGR